VAQTGINPIESGLIKVVGATWFSRQKQDDKEGRIRKDHQRRRSCLIVEEAE
jgi:hypothetical protein